MKIEAGKFRVAVKDSLGIKTIIAQRLGCSLMGLYKWLERHPEAYDVINEESEKLIDKAELNLTEALNQKDWRATEFVLKTKGQKRGFANRPEIQIIDKQQNIHLSNEVTYKFIIDKPHDITNKLETESETASGI